MKLNIRALMLLALVITSPATGGEIDGGVGSGGGSVLPSNPVRPEKIAGICDDLTAQKLLRLFFNGLEAMSTEHVFWRNQPLLRQKLFGAQGPIYRKIKDTRIFVADQAPCYDPSGNAVDGSTLAPVPDRICISSFTIARKLPDTEAFPQVFALIVHEYSHLAGASEEEAGALQALSASTLIAQRLDHAGAIERIWAAEHLISFLRELSKWTKELDLGLARLPAAQRAGLFRRIEQGFQKVLVPSLHPFSVFSAPHALHARGADARAKSILWYLQAVIDPSGAEARRYQRLFGNEESVDLTQWYSQWDPGKQVPNPIDFRIRRIHDDSGLSLELLALVREAAVLEYFVEDTLNEVPSWAR